MERNRSKKAKAFGASGQIKSVKKILEDEDTHIAQCPKIPPQISLVKKDRCVRRFVSVTATISNQAFLLSDGHNQFLTVTNVLGNAVPYVDSWRLKSITCFILGSESVGTAYNVSMVISPVAGDVSSNMFNSREEGHQITSAGPNVYASMKLKCGKRTPLGGWHFTSNVNPTGVLFQYNVVSATPSVAQLITLDLEFETVTNLLGLPLGYGVVTATTTLGTVGGRNISGFALRGINNLG
jgi:hypothetical protein